MPLIYINLENTFLSIDHLYFNKKSTNRDIKLNLMK